MILDDLTAQFAPGQRWRRRRILLAIGVVAPIFAFAAVILAVLAYPGYNNATQYLSDLGGASARHPWLFNGGVMISGVGAGLAGVGFALAVVALLTEPFAFIPTLRLATAFAYQILVPGLAATLIWFHLIGRIGAVKASAFHFLNPFFGVGIAALLLGETITGLDMIGVAIAAGGILAVQLARIRGAGA